MKTEQQRRILVVDDEAGIRESMAGILADEGFVALTAENGEQGLELLENEPVDLVLLDIWMPGVDGMEILGRLRDLYPHLPVIMISGHGTIETAVQATRMGAYDFIEKPLSYDKVILAINNALRLSRLEEENFIYRQQAKRHALTGESAPIRQLRQQIERVAPTEAWVLIRGEHGTGKELVAQTIHRLSPAANQPMVELNCAAIPEELIESELFGHEKGSFTGAATAKRGKFDQADGGLLFLDEIGDMSLATQAKILRILQEQKFERVGGAKTIKVNVRVLAATNKNLEEEIDKGNFRADLFYRLNVVPIFVPPLRRRREDIPLLVADFVAEFRNKSLGGKDFTPEAVAVMQEYDWPGNVRELRNFVERTLIMSPEERIEAAMVRQLLALPGAAAGAAVDPGSYLELSYKDAKRSFEREYLRMCLAANNGNISQTAEQIGLERSHLHKKLKTLELEPEGNAPQGQ
ncbi:sigma-54-dependent transcriptional regulator [Desulfurivibrio alkaliphilus]|uniref:Two component, sigma54 specific, transcriptional regulator, Fis family n=1 Tax=Desulfurivibrio alkaliphilus (strain DSM 19089 / UNIQEM U267 / AHT2) TaxID=589865 RepID=D6Z6U1_DESAT|nr:sigma-54 dependent transcriptional regulator [Desulfurivibrio alkaliphilus]ADH85050.1 two component, sigma54 specific, transcriptional regulator, Fis family [Desulfurivibrio alkaliphilus AHT 2]